ncbi:murein L,D-transpeptidase catalytic domain family protein [Marinobacter sp. F4216]|uniref:murein L,D-transpeptidase catalytic domain family protein n=1 Tax=Marinobacter sp. F4216 TaxID=2874281 RepID=UPI001CBE1465|nr:murein L,D-transpeptidase catalytic domain family protein [Marinobacter sp. F4216]MBZ2170038.1 murein L,D-transpeptidase catalytic domain family protein [Marinobacter sp. F4216]
MLAGNVVRSFLLAIVGSLFPVASFGTSHAPSLLELLSDSAPDLNPIVLRRAVTATQCAIRNGLAVPERLAVIDFSRPSSEERLWIFDLADGRLLLRDLVAHGKNSGLFDSTSFSNVEGSHQSSIGLFLGSESYYGKHGYSLRLDGLEQGFNHRARERAIVIHGADYVSDAWVGQYGRVGRSHGCPAVDRQVIQQVVDNLKGGQLVFKYYPDEQWMAESSLLNCSGNEVAEATVEDGNSG